MKKVDINGHSKNTVQASRVDYAISELADIGIDVHYKDNFKIKFLYQGHEVTFFPFTGWATGKSIRDGRGIQNLIKQLI